MLINIHTHHTTTPEPYLIEVYNQYPWNIQPHEGYYSIGIHPVFINQSHIADDLITITQHISSHKCLAIGEIGLDKLTSVDFEVQKNVFKQQLCIAQEHQIPVIIHCVRAYQEIFEIRKKLNITVPFIFHGFNKNVQLLQQILDNYCIPSFGKNLLHNPNLQPIFANLSENQFFLENDDSQIPIQEIYTKAAELKNCSIEEIEAIVQNQFSRVFINL